MYLRGHPPGYTKVSEGTAYPSCQKNSPSAADSRQLHNWHRGSPWRRMLHVQVYSFPLMRNAHIPVRGSKLCSGFTRLHILSGQEQHSRGKVWQHGSSVYIYFLAWPRRDPPGLRPCHMVAHGGHGYYHSVHTHLYRRPLTSKSIWPLGPLRLTWANRT